MKHKLIKATLGLVAAITLIFAGFGAKTLADSFWSGHTDVESINAALDKINGQIQTKNKALADAKTALTDKQNELTTAQQNLTTAQQDLTNSKAQVTALQQQYNILKNQYDTDTSSLQQQIQQKITEGNEKVAAKQTELAAK